MGTLTCNRCFAKAEASTQEEADDLIDHARGQMIGRPCSGKQSDLVWDGATITATASESSTRTDTATATIISPTKPKSKKSKRG